MLALRLLSEGVEGPNTELIWIMYLGIAFFFLVIFSGWVFGSKKEHEPESGIDEEAKQGKENIHPESKGVRKKK